MTRALHVAWYPRTGLIEGKSIGRLASWAVCCLTLVNSFAAATHAAGFVAKRNFVVIVPPEPSQQAAQQLAAEISRQAERYRREVAKDWLGSALPDGVGRTMINVEFTDEDDVGLTWAKDDARRDYHNIYLKTNRRRVIGTTLAHEVVHSVLATQYPDPGRLAPWVEEGIASQYDDRDRKAERTKLLKWYAATDNWPDVGRIINRASIPSSDRESYTVAATLTELLVQQQDRESFVRFAADGARIGWDAALRRHYRIQDTRQLARIWRQHVQRIASGRNRPDIVPKLVAID